MATKTRRAMPQPGEQAPSFVLSGQSLEGILASGPAVLAFFKISCPTCQLALPYLDRLHRANQGALQFVGVSQNGAADTEIFARHFGVTFPLLLDPGAEGYQASNAYGLTHVPTVFVVEADGVVSSSWNGFIKTEIERLAERIGVSAFPPGADVPAWKPG